MAGSLVQRAKRILNKSLNLARYLKIIKSSNPIHHEFYICVAAYLS